MLLIVEKDGTVSCRDGISNPELYDLNITQNISVEDKFLNGDYYFTKAYFSISNNDFRFIALPANFRGNLYNIYFDDKIIISDNFFALCKILKTVTFNNQYKEYFIRTSYLPDNETWVREIKRLIPHNIYFLRNGELKRKSIAYRKLTDKYNEGKLYQNFKDSLNWTVQKFASDKDALLLSGGADSRLLALLLKKYTGSVNAYTVKMIPENYGNLEDIIGAHKVCSLIDGQCYEIEADFDKIDVGALRDIIEYMPNASHLSMLHYNMLKKISEDSRNTVWCGQNADTMLNLGPSDKVSLSFNGIMSLYKRFCISEEYFKGLKDVKGYKRGYSYTNRFLGGLGLSFYNHTKHQNLALPKTAADLINNYNGSYDYTIYSKKNCEDKPPVSTKMTPKEVKDQLFNNKVENFIKGGESLIIDTTAEIFGIENVVLPYSSEILLPVCNEFRLNFHNLFSPKKFIYNYIKEFSEQYGKEINNFKVSKESYNKYGELKSVHQTYEYILYQTDFGKEININKIPETPNGYTGIQFFKRLLGEYWIKTTLDLLQFKYNVEVKMGN